MKSNNNSLISETSSKFNEESRLKIDNLLALFTELGWDSQKDLTQDEVRYFLNNRSKDGQFDINLLEKLISILDIDDNNRISVEEFIKGYLQFESDLKKNSDEFNRKFIQEQNNLSNLEEQCRLYKSEKLNDEGFCENAKITVEITDVVIQKPIEGISAIIIKVIYNDKIKETKLQIGSNNVPVKEKFEFKPTSKRDHFEFIMIKVDDQNQESDIGSKVFPLEEITSQEEYIVQITIPEIEDEEQIAAYINCKILLFWSDYEFYEEKKKKSEQKLKKLNDALVKTGLYLQKIREVYGDLQNTNFNNTNNLINNLKNSQQQNNFNQNQYINEENNINNYNNGYDNYMYNEGKEELINYQNKYISPSTKNEFLKAQKYGQQLITNQYSNENPQLINFENSFEHQNIPIKGKKSIQLLGFCMTLLGIVGSLKRPDFPNILGGIFVILGCNIGIKGGVPKAVKWFKYILFSILILFIYDIIWISTHFKLIWVDSLTGGYRNLIGFLSILCCVGNIIIKSLLSLLLYKQYTNIKNLEKQNSENYI